MSAIAHLIARSAQPAADHGGHVHIFFYTVTVPAVGVIEEQDRVIGFDLPHPASFTGFGCVIEVRRDIAGTVLECQFQLVAGAEFAE